jgi:hypothetical protein
MQDVPQLKHLQIGGTLHNAIFWAVILVLFVLLTEGLTVLYDTALPIR